MLAMIHRAIQTAIVLALSFVVVPCAYSQHRGSSSRGASSPVPRYAPASPTTSPYLNLLNRNGSAATNYFGLVRPQEHQQDINATQAQQNTSQQQQISSLREQQQDFSQPQIKPTGTAGWFQNLGTKSPYQQTSHFYGQWPDPKNKTRRQTTGGAGR
jgi:hypothetical protein